MRCRYLNNSEQIGGTVNAFRIRENTFSCSINSKPKLVELTVHLVAFEKSKELFTYAETTIQIYKCDSYRTCGNCLQSPEIKCHWCLNSLACQDSTSNCQKNSNNDTAMCPRLEEITHLYLPNGIKKEISLNIKNMVSDHTYKCVIEQNGTDFTAQASKETGSIKCSFNVSFNENKSKMNLPLSVFQMNENTHVILESTKKVSVTVYKCEYLAADCTRCGALKPDKYDCKWCQSGQCGHKTRCSQNISCPAPIITQIDPPSGGYKGGSQLVMKGTDFGTDRSLISNVKAGDLRCLKLDVQQFSDSDFNTFNTEIHCTLEAKDNIGRVGAANVTCKFDSLQIKIGNYSFKNPVVSGIEPAFGLAIGGTLVTLHGDHLGIERSVPSIRLLTIGSCIDVSFYDKVLTCTTPFVDDNSAKNATSIRLRWGDEFYDSPLIFRYLLTPNITKMSTGKSILSGGTKLAVDGINLNNTAKVSIEAVYAREKKVDICKPESDTKMRCNLPMAPSTAKNEMTENLGGKRRRKKRSTEDESISIDISIKMDGYLKEFKIDYFHDPVLESFQETTTVFKTGERRLMITGNYLNLVGGANDYSVRIGNGKCLVIEVTRSNITCIPPSDSPNKTAEKFEVEVQLGNFKKEVGYVRYEIVTLGASLQNIVIIVVPIVAGLVLIGIIAGGIGTCKYQRVKGKAKIFEKNLVDMEMKIKKVFREEFLDMHTTMSRVNENLIEKGFPYNNYQRYTFLMLFPGEWHMEEHPLMHEPVVSDSIRFKLKKGMDTFEQLLLNKFFLVSVISTMEKQRKFFLKERSNMAGHLSIALLGRMDYFHEILVLLLTTLIDETPQKQQKTLFRRCESITEKLLSSWLVLGLYYHVKMHSGSPLYMLLKGTQLTMESGPIDAVTGDSKYTLSEDKLLRQDDKNTTLTLKVLVENSDEVRECKVLDCDTISQVKAKCLSQMYVNYPASQLTVDSSELNLEWHWGSGGRLVIKDEDTTSKRDGDWLQLNTLEHYKVVDGSSMALVDPNGLIDQEDYVNLAHIKIDADVGDGSIHSNEPLTHKDLENGEPITRWHLVKSDEEKQSTGCVVTDELYLNRLITTKQSVLEYMRNLFDTILNPTIPPPAKFLFDFLDKAGEKNKVDVDALHAWKSQCYTIRFWATLINKPYNLFDQKIPSYVETSMEVISQVLIESCSLKGHQYTKDSSPGKLIFKNDMMTYRDRVKEYYTQVKATNQTPEDLRQYLTDLNHNQNKETHYNRHAALYSLYCQLQPYMEWIIEDLEDNEDTKSLHLDRKLASLNEQMEEE